MLWSLIKTLRFNHLFLTETANYANIHLHFNQKLMTAKLKQGELNFTK